MDLLIIRLQLSRLQNDAQRDLDNLISACQAAFPEWQDEQQARFETHVLQPVIRQSRWLFSAGACLSNRINRLIQK